LNGYFSDHLSRVTVEAHPPIHHAHMNGYFVAVMLAFGAERTFRLCLITSRIKAKQTQSERSGFGAFDPQWNHSILGANRRAAFLATVPIEEN